MSNWYCIGRHGHGGLPGCPPMPCMTCLCMVCICHGAGAPLTSSLADGSELALSRFRGPRAHSSLLRGARAGRRAALRFAFAAQHATKWVTIGDTLISWHFGADDA